MVASGAYGVLGRRWQQTLLAGCLLLNVNVAVNAAESVQSLRYGTTLYHFYQRDYYTALTELMVGQQLDQLGVHGPRAELLRGGMNLSYGMDSQAEKIFDQLLVGEGAQAYPEDRDKAWFYLARMAWQRGELEKSRSALDKLPSEYQGKFSAEANYLRSSIALSLGNEQESIRFAQLLPLDSPWQYYLYYNLGAAQARQGNWQEAINYYSRFGEMSFSSQESKAIRDKAITATGFALMASNKFDEARVQFARVRLDGPMSGRALLGYGWASSEMGDFPMALSSWQTLTGRKLTGGSARESLLAIPYVYEELDRPAIALEHYRRAANAYQLQLSTVRSTMAEFKEGKLEELLDLGVGAPGSVSDAHGWVFGGDILPLNSKAGLLAATLTGNDFQLALRELQDLYRMAWHMDDAEQRLQVLSQVDADQRVSWSTVVEGDGRNKLEQQKHTLEQKVAQLKKRLERAESNPDTAARLFADAAQNKRWEKVDHASQLLTQMTADTSLEAKKLQLALMRGLLMWADSEQFVARSWTMQRDVKELEALVAQSTELLGRVDEAIAQRGEREFSLRISTMRDRMAPAGQRLERAIGHSEAKIRRLAISELKGQEQHLSHALGRSRLAIARLYDESSQELPL